MDFANSYFAIRNPLEIIDRWLNPYKYQATVQLRNRALTIKWTKRADDALQLRSKPLVVEMQLYFSCVVKKRILFIDKSNAETINVINNLDVGIRTLQAAACSPEDFANNYPVNSDFDSIAASKMSPSLLCLDYANNHWQGDFVI